MVRDRTERQDEIRNSFRTGLAGQVSFEPLAFADGFFALNK